VETGAREGTRARTTSLGKEAVDGQNEMVRGREPEGNRVVVGDYPDPSRSIFIDCRIIVR
jgi:hypothetical protein